MDTYDTLVNRILRESESSQYLEMEDDNGNIVMAAADPDNNTFQWKYKDIESEWMDEDAGDLDAYTRKEIRDEFKAIGTLYDYVEDTDRDIERRSDEVRGDTDRDRLAGY